MAFVQSSTPKSDPQTTSTLAPTGKVGNKVAPTVPLDWDSAPPFRYKPTIPRKASKPVNKPVDKPRNEILEIPDPDPNASLWEELGFGPLDESDTSPDNMPCTESQEEAAPPHEPQFDRARSLNPPFRFPPGFQPQEPLNAPDVQAEPSQLQNEGIGLDPSSPIVIPDDKDDDGESSASHSDTRPGKPDHIKGIDPMQDHQRPASQLPAAVDKSLGETLAGERDSSECKVNRVHRRTTNGAVDTTSPREAARSDDQPAKPDGYGREYSTGCKGLASKHSPQKRTVGSSPDISGNAQDTSRKRRKLLRPGGTASIDEDGSDTTEAFSSDNDMYGRFTLSKTERHRPRSIRQKHKQASRINWDVPGFRTPSPNGKHGPREYKDTENAGKAKAKRSRRSTNSDPGANGKNDGGNGIAMVCGKKEWEVKRIRDENKDQYLIQWPCTWVSKRDVHADEEVRKFYARLRRREAAGIKK